MAAGGSGDGGDDDTKNSGDEGKAIEGDVNDEGDDEYVAVVVASPALPVQECVDEERRPCNYFPDFPASLLCSKSLGSFCCALS